MRRMDLLPVTYVERRRERRNITLVIFVGLALVLLLVIWYVLLLSQVADAESDLTAVQQENAALQQEIDALQEFALLDAEVTSKRTALQTVMAGDLDWPALMTEIAMVVPGEVWLDTFTASAGTTEGAASVPTETNPIRLSSKETAGRIQFVGNSVCMPGVAKWLVRLGTVESFSAIWLNDATEADTQPGCEPVGFNNSIELSRAALSDRFQGELE